MLQDRVGIVERNLDREIEAAPTADARLARTEVLRQGSSLTVASALDLFADMVTSRALDVAARDLKAQGRGYYTISSAGHEANAVLGAVLRPTDPCFLHYRSGALMAARARRASRGDPAAERGAIDDMVRSTILSFLASADDPVAGGRHKVWGSRPLWVPPQTSTIGSHPPKAVGTAFALERARRMNIDVGLDDDAVVLCSLGDASANHATALTGVNSGRYARRRGNAVPVLFVVEDNGIGISVDTPRGWVADTYQHLSQLTYVRAAGDLADVWDAATRAVNHCRRERAPVLLHLDTVRLWGHAGSDVETAYRTLAQVEADEARDPLLTTARLLLASGAASRDDLARIVAEARARVRDQVSAVTSTPTRHLTSAAEIMAPIFDLDLDAVRADAERTVPDGVRQSHFAGELPEQTRAPTKRTLAAHLNSALHDELLRRPEALVFGEDVGRKGGVYHVTAGLQPAFGQGRVFDTLLDETTILGVAQGAGLLGLLPIPEIQYLAYLHNALDQLRGEACSLSFFSGGQFRNPMVVRIASFAYQKGFGGHFHNDNAFGALRDIPGLVVAAPCRGDDAARMLRGATALASEAGRVVAFLEPIALYHARDLHADGDGAWLTDYPPPGTALLPGEVGTYGPEGADAEVLVVTYANGVPMTLRALRSMGAEQRVRVLDLRWLQPLPIEDVLREAAPVGRVLVADEARATGGGVADALVAGLVEGGYDGRIATVRSKDSYVPLGPAADAVLLGEDDIAAGIDRLLP